MVNITMTKLTIAHFSEEKKSSLREFPTEDLFAKMSDIEGTNIETYHITSAIFLSQNVRLFTCFLDLVQRINDDQNHNLKEKEIELIQDRTQF